MGRTRQRQQAQAQAAEVPYKEIALALSQAAAGSSAAGAAAVVVAVLVGLGIPEPVAQDVAVRVSVEIPVVDGTAGILRTARIEQVVYRALYSYYSANRLRQAKETGGQELFERQKERELFYYESHLAMNRKREGSVQATLRAIERWGDVLSWNATIRPTNRPNHRQAHRQNWRPAAGPPILTGALPGTLPFCLCFAGPPNPGASMLV